MFDDYDRPNDPDRTASVWVKVHIRDGQPGERRAMHLVGGVDVERARKALLALLLFRPEHGTERFDATNPMYELGDEMTAFLSESYLYVALGEKDSARTIRAYVSELREALGIPRDYWRQAIDRDAAVTPDP